MLPEKHKLKCFNLENSFSFKVKTYLIRSSTIEAYLDWVENGRDIFFRSSMV